MGKIDLVDDAFDLGPKYGVNEWWRHYWKILRVLDRLYDARMHLRMRGHSNKHITPPRSRVLIAAVEVPGREEELRRLINFMCQDSNHDVDTAVVPMGPVGKFQNIENAIGSTDLSLYDWLLVTDDDVEIPENFLNDLIRYATSCKLAIAQPAHRFLSFSTFKVTRRHWNTLVRKTGFVEIGPVTLLHRDVFEAVMPFPNLRWAWGLDMYWAHLAKQRGFRIGVVDAVPLRHFRPIAATYSGEEATGDAKNFLRRNGFNLSKDEMLSPGYRIA